MYCNSCGQGIVEGARFCAGCGAAAQVAAPATLFCASCGTSIPQAGQFCPACGQPAARTPAYGVATMPRAETRYGGFPRTDRVELRRQRLCFRAYPVWIMVLLSVLTLGTYTIFWLNHWHGLMPKRRADDPSTAKAIWFLFIPLFGYYWLFESLLRLCTRLDEELADAGLPDRVPKELVRWFCIFSIVPYVDFVSSPILGAIAAGRLQSLVNRLARFDLPEPSGQGSAR